MRALENIAGARRRLLRGYEIEKRQYKSAPCAPALFISPPACSASVTPATLPTPHINSSSGSMEMRALPLEAPNPPTFGPLQSARRLQAYDSNLQETGILISAQTESGQQLNDRLRFDRNLTTVCHRALFGRTSDASRTPK